MAVFVDLEDEDVQQPHTSDHGPRSHNQTAVTTAAADDDGTGIQKQENSLLPAEDNPNRDLPLARALACYPIVASLGAGIDLNTLDNLARTCKVVRLALLNNRKALLASTMRCVNEDVPVDPEETLRFRARAGNLFYNEESGRGVIFAKAGQCARDLVAECRRCGTVVCRNCAIKPPAPIVLRDRFRRLCEACVKAPLGSLVKPPLDANVRIDSDDMERAICKCGIDGVWLCQPCGRTIRNDDYDYRSIWNWRYQYTGSLGGLGTGIGEGDRGVTCGRDSECCAAREREQETDGDAEDAAREADNAAAAVSWLSAGGSSAVSPLVAPAPPWSIAGTGSVAGSTSSLALSSVASSSSSTSSLASAAAGLHSRTPSPQLKPGYERHEIEGIGGVMKKKMVRMVKIAACVPEWEDERVRGEFVAREIQGKRRAWCGWCWRVIPSRKDYEMDRKFWRDQDAAAAPDKEGGSRS